MIARESVGRCVTWKDLKEANFGVMILKCCFLHSTSKCATGVNEHTHSARQKEASEEYFSADVHIESVLIW